MPEQITSQRIVERNGGLAIRLTSEDPCPQDCPFLETISSEVVEDNSNSTRPKAVDWLMRLAGREVEEPEDTIHTTQRCKFTAFGNAYPMPDLVQEVRGMEPEDPTPQDLGCPSDIMVEVDDANAYVTIGDMQLDPLPRAID